MDAVPVVVLSPGLALFDLLPINLLEYILMFCESHDIVYFSTAVSKSLSIKCRGLNWRNFMIRDYHEFFTLKISHPGLLSRIEVAKSDNKTRQSLLSGRHGEFQPIFDYARRRQSANIQDSKDITDNNANENVADNPLFLNKKYRLRYGRIAKQESRSYIITVDFSNSEKFNPYANAYSRFSKAIVSARYEYDNAHRIMQIMSNRDCKSMQIKGLPPLTYRYIYCVFSPDANDSYSNDTPVMNMQYYFLSKEALIKACIEEYYEHKKAEAKDIKRFLGENGSSEYSTEKGSESKIDRDKLKERLFNALDDDAHDIIWMTDISEGTIRIPKRVLVMAI